MPKHCFKRGRICPASFFCAENSLLELFNIERLFLAKGSGGASCAASPAGIWAIGTGLEDIRFLDNLTTHLRFAYFQGTSDVEEYNKAAKAGGYKDAFRDYRVLDSSDWGVEINFDNKINIYENLDMYVQLAYIHMDVEHSASDFQDNAWKSYVGFTYNF